MTQSSAKTIGIYVTEEQELYRQIYKASFEAEMMFRFIGVSSNGNESALQNVLLAEKPDVLVMGAKQLEVGLLEEVEHICTQNPDVGIVLLMTSIEESHNGHLRKLVQKCHSGIAIYLKQSLDNPRQLHDIIISVSRGQVIFDPKVAGSILKDKTVSPFMKLLTERELEILNLLSAGYTNQGIAKSLCIDVKTVAHHLNNIYSKLKEDEALDLKHPRVSVARLYLETTGELMPLKFNSSQFIS
jgi:two-component system, NarL family, vancomycin resistance associated response regulator VraR